MLKIRNTYWGERESEAALRDTQLEASDLETRLGQAENTLSEALSLASTQTVTTPVEPSINNLLGVLSSKSNRIDYR